MLSVPGSSLRSTFEAALVLQRAGDADAALERYELFLQAARSLGTQVPPESFAEVLVNMGTIHAKRGDVSRAKQLFSEALDAREMGTAHLNLALLELSAASRGGGMPPSALSKAEIERRMRRDGSSQSVPYGCWPWREVGGGASGACIGVSVRGVSSASKR